jgi:hypothetical protein
MRDITHRRFPDGGVPDGTAQLTRGADRSASAHRSKARKLTRHAERLRITIGPCVAGWFHSFPEGGRRTNNRALAWARAIAPPS